MSFLLFRLFYFFLLFLYLRILIIEAEAAAAAAEQYHREVQEKEEEAAAYANLQRGRAVVGKPVRVQWGEGMSYLGRVTKYNEDEGKHQVEYTDGDVKWHDLDQIKWSEVTEMRLRTSIGQLIFRLSS